MKKNYFLSFALTAIFAAGSSLSYAQLKVAAGNPTFVNDHVKNKLSNKAIAVCGADTVDYPLVKATGIQALNLNNATSGSAGGQYYNANDSITVNGFNFYAWKPDTANGSTITISAELYTAGADSLPSGMPLATQLIIIDTTFGGGALTTLLKSITFPSPVTVTQPYVLVVANNSATPINILSNSYSNGDGRGEDLSSINLGGTFVKGSLVAIGPSGFDADFLFHPHVSYDLNTDFTLNPDSLYSVPSTISVTNTSGGVLNDRMYNFGALAGLISNTYDFGNGGGAVKVIDSMVTYQTLQNYTITLNDTIFQYNGSLCVSSESKVLAVGLSTGLNDMNRKEVKFSIHPNPSKGNLTLESPVINERVFIFSIDGKLVHEENILSNKINLDLTGLTNGIYFVKIGDTSKKLIINQ